MTATVRKAAIGCVALASCGGSSSHPDGGLTGGAIAIDDFASAVVTAICQRAVDCSLYADVANCAATRGINDLIPADAVERARRGRAGYDPVAAAACLDAIPRTCWTQSDWIFEKWQFVLAAPICRAVFKGTVAPGGACCSGIECTTQICNVSGLCAADPLVPLGGACDSNQSLYCDVDLFCSPEGKCLGTLPVGASCADPGPMCAAPAGCPTTGQSAFPPGICVALPDEGEACDWNLPTPCLRLDDYCDPDTNVCTRRVPLGAPCIFNLFQCVAYAACTNDVCTLASPMLGEPCRTDGTCVNGLPCVDNVCSSWPAATPLDCGL